MWSNSDHPECEEAHKNSTSQVEIKADGSKNIKTSEKPFDIAALEINDKDFCKKVAKVPSCSDPKESSQSEPSKDEKLFMGSSWMGKLMRLFVFSEFYLQRRTKYQQILPFPRILRKMPCIRLEKR